MTARTPTTRRAPAVFLTVLVFYAASCVSAHWAAKALREGGSAGEREFARRAHGFLDDFLRRNPVFGTVNGYHAYDSRWDDLSPAAVAATAEAYRGHRAAIEAIDPAELSPSVAVDRRIVLNAIDVALFELAELQRPERDPGIYNEIIGFGGFYLAMDVQGPDGVARLETLAARMENLPAFLDSARADLSNPPKVFTSFAIEQSAGNVELYEKTVTRAFDTAAPVLKERLISAQSRAVAALRSWREWLSYDLLPRSKGNWRLGAERFKKRLSLILGSDIRPEEIVASAREDLARRRAAMLQTAMPIHEKLFPTHRHAETGDALTNAVVSEVLSGTIRGDLALGSRVDEMSRRVSALREFVEERRLVTLPPAGEVLLVEPAPAFADGMAVAVFNPGPAGAGRSGPSLWVSTYARDSPDALSREYDDCAMQVVAMHEAFPGHYAQWWHARRSPGISVWRRVFANAAFSEGWAAFAEEMVFEHGYADANPGCRAVFQKLGLRSALNAIIDERFHAGRDDDTTLDAWAMDLLVNAGFQNEAEARLKVRRARLTAAQLSTYFAGRAIFENVFGTWKTQEGSAFNIGRFTDKVLSYGAVPPAEVGRLLFDSKSSGK